MHIRDISTLPLISSLPADEISHLEATLSTCELPSGEVLFREGDTDDKFYILLEGQVEIVKALGSPEERILGVIQAGNLLGEMSLFSREGYHTASVRALTPLQLLIITRTELEALLHRQPHLAFELIRLLSKRLEQSENLTILDLREKNQQLREAYDELKAAQEQIIEKERLEKELEVSAKIQQSILPKTLPSVVGYEFGALMIPARAVGGDFYTFIKLGKDQLGIVVGDVCDKGVPAALFMALTYALIRAEAIRTKSPNQVLRKVNQLLLQMNSSGMFVTLVYGVLDCTIGEFNFARAAHPTPYLLDGEGQIVPVPVSTGQPLGLFDNPSIDEQCIHISPGGTLLLYSDGVSETVDSQGKEFCPGGIDPSATLLYKTMTANRGQTAQGICEQLWQIVQAYGGILPQQDDFTTVIVKRSAI